MLAKTIPAQIPDPSSAPPKIRRQSQEKEKRVVFAAEQGSSLSHKLRFGAKEKLAREMLSLRTLWKIRPAGSAQRERPLGATKRKRRKATTPRPEPRGSGERRAPSGRAFHPARRDAPPAAGIAIAMTLRAPSPRARTERPVAPGIRWWAATDRVGPMGMTSPGAAGGACPAATGQAAAPHRAPVPATTVTVPARHRPRRRPRVPHRGPCRHRPPAGHRPPPGRRQRHPEDRCQPARRRPRPP